MIRRPSIYVIRSSNSFANKISQFSSSSSLITLHDSQSKPPLNPFYNLLPPTHNPNNLVNLISSILKDKSSHLSLLHNDIKAILPHMGPLEISRVLLRCQSDHSSALTFFNWVKNDLDITPSLHNYCVIVHILAWSRVFSQAMKLLSELIQLVEVEGVPPNDDIYESLVGCTEDCNWNPVIFDMLVKAYVKADMVEKGLTTFRRNIEARLIPSVIACNCLLSGLSRFNHIAQCWEVYEEMGRLGIHRNAYTFNIMTHVLCKNGDTDKVNGFLEKMEEEGFEPDLITYNTLVNSYCKKRRLDDAFYMYKIMYIRGVMPNLITHTALMSGLCEEGKVKEAHRLFHEMVYRGIDPDIVSYNTLLSGYSRVGKMQICRSLLHEMVGNEISPDKATCRVIVEGYVREGKLLSALNVVEELKRFGTKVPEDVYDYLIVELCNNGRPIAARSFLLRIFQDGYIPKMSTCNKLVETLCEFNNVKEAEGLLEEMVCSGIQPDVEISRTLISGYCEENKVDKAVSLLKFFAKEFQSFNEFVFRAFHARFILENLTSKCNLLLFYFQSKCKLYDIKNDNLEVQFLCSPSDTIEKRETLQDVLKRLSITPISIQCKSIENNWQRWDDTKCSRTIVQFVSVYRH
ncbi:hypothetical protein Fmac_016943 [Flemingia macrophylla]|uniref:Pentatricopeptide repeat-containing protein n=1 Tax=Flemingia macrophylla TaxID=520843 RepID=A0ABD1MIU0_9FABA